MALLRYQGTRTSPDPRAAILAAPPACSAQPARDRPPRLPRPACQEKEVGAFHVEHQGSDLLVLDGLERASYGKEGVAGLGREPAHARDVAMACFRPEKVFLIHVEGRALRTSILLVAVLVQEHRDAVSRELLGSEGELDGRVRGEEHGAGAYGAFGLLALVAVFGGENAGAEDQYLHPLGERFERRVAVVGVEVVEEALQVGVAARVVEDGDGRGVLGLSGDDVPDVQVLGGFGLCGPEKELVGSGRALLAGNDPAYGTRGLIQITIVQHLVPPVRC